MKYFTSDLHLGHTSILRYSNRPFSSIEEMNEAIVSNWNNVVHNSSDEVYLLGDVSMINADQTVDILNRMNGRIHLITGNHDKHNLKSGRFRQRFETITPLLEIKIADGEEPTGAAHLTLCHFPMRSWNQSHHGSIHLHGHTHGGTEPHGKSVDIGVDSSFVTGTREYRPFLYSEIKNFMRTRTPALYGSDRDNR